MRIIECGQADDALWNAFVDGAAAGTFYHRAEWRAINERCFGHRTSFLAARDGDRIVGVFPLVQLKSLAFGNIACSMPFVNYCGPCGETPEVEQALLEAARDVAARWKVDYLEIRSRHNVGDAFPVSTHKVSMTIELAPDAEQIFNAFKGDHRRDIRRAYQNGFVAKFGTTDLLEDFFAVLSECWRDLGTPIYSIEYLRAILDAFPGMTRICVVYAADGTPAAGAFDGLYNGRVEGMWLGTRNAYRKQMVGYVLYWELIKHACGLGLRSFHLGRSSKDSGGEQFKKKWNSTAAQLYWQYILRTRNDIPELNPSNAKYRLAQWTWQRLPVPVTRLAGPLIARSIP